MTERRTKAARQGEIRKEPCFESALDAIPIFPLPQVVLFPEAILPLHIFEPRYRVMLRDCLESHGALVIAHIVGGEDEHGRPKIAPVAGGGIVVQHEPLGAGRANIVVLGLARVRLDELDPRAGRASDGAPAPRRRRGDGSGRPYRVARATVLEDTKTEVKGHERAALVSAATMFAAEVKKHDPYFSFRMPATLDAAHLADLCAYQLIVDPNVRQAVLDELDPSVRVGLVTRQLAVQQGAMIAGDGDKVLN